MELKGFSRTVCNSNNRTMRMCFSVISFFTALMSINIISVFSSPCQPNTMVITTQPGDGFGGDPLLIQPVITQLNSSNKPCITDSSSRVYIEIKKNPAVFAKIEQYNTTVVASGVEWVPPRAMVIMPFDKGVAAFSGIYIGMLGEGFTLNFVSIDLGKQIESTEFKVSLGVVYTVLFDQPPGTARGGEVFVPQPRVRVADRGYNTVITDSTTIIRVEMHSRPPNQVINGTLTSIVGDRGFEATCNNGVASFIGLKIDKAGFPYALRFTANHVAFQTNGQPDYVDQVKMTVGVGKLNTVNIITHPLIVIAGEAMNVSERPKIELLDTGGNRLIEDVTSSVTVSIFINPSAGRIDVSNITACGAFNGNFDSCRAKPGCSFVDATQLCVGFQLTVPIVAGVGEFDGLMIDKVGPLYKLQYSVDANPLFPNPYLWTGSVIGYSPSFDVVLGAPFALKLIQSASDAWAGGTPFQNQPIVGLIDGGGNIIITDSTNTVTAEISVNPTGYPLLGVTVITFDLGVAVFKNLAIEKQSSGYRLKYSTSVSPDLTIDQSVSVRYAAEFELRSNDAQPNDRLGKSTDIQLVTDEELLAGSTLKDIAVLGAPYEDRALDEIQVIRSVGVVSELVSEIQTVSSSAFHLNEVQIFKTSALYGMSLSRYYDPTGNDKVAKFRYTWKTITSRYIHSDVSASQLSIILMEDFKSVGIGYIDVSRKVRDDECGCLGVFEWRITFTTAKGFIPLFVVDETQMNVTDSFKSTFISRDTFSTILSGSFKLSMPQWIHKGHNSEIIQSQRTSDPIPYNATANEMVNILSTSLWPFNTINVTRSAANSQRGYIWTVTFAAKYAHYEVPQMYPDLTDLKGYGRDVKVYTPVQGKAPVGGTFRLSFREHPGRHTTYGEWATTTSAISWNATAYEMKAALESLQTISTVDVKRTDGPFARSYGWTVTFKKVADFDQGIYPYRDDPDLKQFSYLADSVGNLVPLVANNTKLTGTDSYIKIEAVYDSTDLSVDDDLAHTDTTYPSSHLEVERRARRGGHGQRAGAAYVFTRVEERWPQEYKLIGTDTDSYDRFGTSVSVSGIRVAVGAPGAEDYGQSDQKTILCTASKGYFTITFRGQTTVPIDASTATVKSFIIDLENIMSIGRIEPVGFTKNSAIDMNALLCDDTNPKLLVLLLVSPKIGEINGVEPFLVNLEPMHMTKLSGVVQVGDVQEATREENFQNGAVYVFQRDATTGTWSQEAKIISSVAKPGDEFGGTVFLRGSTLVVSATEDDRDGDGSGAVYHFYQKNGTWTEMQKFGYLDHECGLGCPYSTFKYRGLQFGFSMALQGNALIIAGFPKTKELLDITVGKVYIYKRLAPGEPFVPEQLVEDATGHIGDAFGYSLSVHANTLAVGVPYRKGDFVAQGTVALFERENEDQLFYPHSHLQDKNAKGGDRFGLSVSIEDKTLVASYHEAFPEFNWRMRKSVQSITTRASSTIGGYFYATWRVQQKSAPIDGQIIRGSVTDYLPAGTIVEARYGGEGTGLLSRQPVNILYSRWYRGRVTRAPRMVGNTDKTYGIQYENGLWEPDVTRDRIRRVSSLIREKDHRKTYRILKTTRMQHDITASALRDRIRTELGTGEIFCDRIGPDSHGGYTWRVTFQGYPAEVVPKLGARADGLTGKNAEVRVKRINTPMLNMRKGIAVFTRNETSLALANPYWLQQAKVAPASHQGSDLFGAHQIHVRGTFCIASAANRDSLSSGTNSGGAFMFNLDFLSLKFTQQSYIVNENVAGGKQVIEVERCKPYCHSGSGNYTSFVEYQIGDGAVSGLPVILSNPKMYLRGDKCPYKEGCASTATGREDCLVRSAGLEECLWLPSNGKSTHFASYDALGLSDYVPIYGPLSFEYGGNSSTIDVIITNDDIFESPNEMVNIRLLAPGFQPTFGGQLWSTVTIQDDGDGGVGTEVYFDNFNSEDLHIGFDKFGYAMSMTDPSNQKPTPGMYSPLSQEAATGHKLAVGCPWADYDNVTHVGTVHIFEKDPSSGIWTRSHILKRPGSVTTNAYFGTSVSMFNGTIIVGAPGIHKAYIFRYKDVWNKIYGVWEFEQELSWDETDSESHFADTNAVAIWGRWAIVGAKGLEAVYIYKDTYNYTAQAGSRNTTNHTWVKWQRIRTDFNDTVILRTRYMNHNDFGAAVAIWSDTLLIGAPKADNAHQTYADHYGRTPNPSTKVQQGYGRPNEKGFHGRGIVYQYMINVTSGYWDLIERMQAKDKQALDQFGTSIAIDQDYLVIGAPGEDIKSRTTWDFEMGDLSGWHKSGDAFDYQPTMGDNTDARDNYGYTIMTGEDTTYYTRNYWSGEGDRVFQGQGGLEDHVRQPAGEKIYTYTEKIHLPTFAYKGYQNTESKKRGKYWIGTYEKRPDASYPAGTVQGDVPTGTLTSDPFMIAGTEMSFLVGGGCRITEVWVELFVDGENGYFPSYKAPTTGGYDPGEYAQSVYRVTGKCNERMERVYWDLSRWIGKIGQIRIVDMSSNLWAHINVDDFQFNWDNEPASGKGVGNLENCHYGQCGHHYGENSGAAYVYRRISKQNTGTINGLAVPELCQQFCDSFGCFFNGYTEGWGGEVGDIDRFTNCHWVEEQKLQASDKRELDRFGTSVDVDFGSGMIIVGAPGARLVDIFNRNSIGGRNQKLWRPTGGFAPSTAESKHSRTPTGGAPEIGTVHRFAPDDQPARSGSVYVFKRREEARAGNGDIVDTSMWNVTEKMKLQSPTKDDNFRFGYSVALRGYMVFGGAPKEPSTDSEVHKQVGEVSFYNIEFERVRFRQTVTTVNEYSSEQDPNFVDIFFDRVGDLSKSLTFRYATSDITAIGTPQKDVELCHQFFKSERGECGDYIEQTGTITFGVNQNTAVLRIYIIDDYCPEQFDEIFKITLFSPGGDAILGKDYSGYVRIQDDDFDLNRPVSAAYCKRYAPVYSEIE